MTNKIELRKSLAKLKAMRKVFQEMVPAAVIRTFLYTFITIIEYLLSEENND